MIPRVSLVTYDEPVARLSDTVYSTNPHTAEGDNGISYIVKDMDIEVVFAEIVGHRLAQEVGLDAPDTAACVGGDVTYAGSARVTGTRMVDPWLNRPAKVVNYASLYDLIVVDTWLANWDRNMGAVVGSLVGDGNLRLVFVDFEKSVTLRRNPLINTPRVEPRQLWPSDLLGTVLRQTKPPRPPQPIIERIRNLSEERCAAIINAAVDAIGLEVDWAENSVQALVSRAKHLQTRAEEVWAI